MERNALEELVFKHDFDRALATRFAPAPKRFGLMLLIALDHELSRIDRATSEPLLRRIKIQFWRDAIFDNKSAGLPLVTALQDCFSTSTKHFEGLELLLDAYERRLDQPALELAHNPPKTECEAVLFRLLCEYLHPFAKPMKPAFFKQCGAVYVGIDQLQDLSQEGDLKKIEKVRRVENVRQSYLHLYGDLKKTPDSAVAGILSLALVPPYLDLYQTSDNRYGKPAKVHPLKKAFIMWRALRFGFKPLK